MRRKKKYIFMILCNKTNILGLLLLCICFACQVEAANIVRYVDTGSDAAGDGTTAATSSGDNTHAYQSLNAWEAAEQTDLDTANNTHTVHCNRTNGGGVDQLLCTILGWTTSATDYITITADDFPSDGVWDGTKYLLENNNDAQEAMRIRTEYVRIRKMQILVTTTSGTRYGLNISSVGSPSSFIIDSCIFKGDCTGTGLTVGVYVNDADAEIVMYNTIAYGFVSGVNTAFYGVYTPNITSFAISNCTVYSNYVGIRTAAAAVVKNCAVGNNVNDFYGGGSPTFTIDYIVSDDNHSGDCANYWSAPTAGTGDWTSDFATPGSDFTLLVTATDLIDDGLADLFAEDDDIIGTARPQAGGWDIGAYEFVAAAPPGGGQFIMITTLPMIFGILIVVGSFVYSLRERWRDGRKAA